MKFNSLILLLVSAFILFSCDSGLKFNNPLENNPDANNQGNSDAEMQDADSDEPTDSNEAEDTDPTDSEPEDTEPDNPDSTPEQPDNGDSEPDDTDTDDSDSAPDNSDSTPDDDTDTSDSTDDSDDSEPDDTDTTDDGDSSAPDEDDNEPDEEPTTRTATCSGLPANASWHNGSSITQTFDGNDWYPLTTGFYSETAVANECGFKCNQGYEWIGNQCVKPTTPCSPNPCTSISNSTGNCTVSGTGYICGCQSGYEWSVNLCIMTAEEECSEAGGTWDSDECTKTADCPSKPANTEWNDNGANGTYTQTWTSSSGWIPASQTSSYSTTAGVCKYKCDSSHTWENSSCINQKTVNCPSKPANTVWNDNGANGTYTQTWSSSNGWTPASQTSSYSTTAGVCQYKCASGFNWTNGSCTSGGSSTLPECNASTTSFPCQDSSSKYIWSEKANSSLITWSNAKSHCTGLNSSNYGGFSSGWHLPTISELRTLIQNCPGTQMPPSGSDVCLVRSDEGNVCLASSCSTNSACESCSSDSNGGHSKFGDTESFWSSSILSSNSTYVWYVNFSNGSVINKGAGLINKVRCVRNAE